MEITLSKLFPRSTTIISAYVENGTWVPMPIHQDEMGYRLKIIESRGKHYAAMCSDESEVRKDSEFNVLVTDINKLIEPVFQNEHIDGIVINPYTKVLCLDKEFLLKCLLHAKYPEQRIMGSHPRNWGRRLSIETIVLSDLMNKEFEAANQRYVVTGADGIPIVYIVQLGHKIFPVREEDIDCRLIDMVKYSAMIQQLIDEQKGSINNNFDYFTIGKLTGYEVALDCDIPHIRFEIFKANSLIDGFDEFSEVRDIYTEDEKYYKGYTHALMHSILSIAIITIYCYCFFFSRNICC